MRTKEEVFKIAYGRQRILGKVEGGGNINRMATRYTVSRKAGHGVTSALKSAVITRTGPEWYHGPSLGKASEDGHRCVTAPSAFGLRFVDYSDKIIGVRRAMHEGWYTSHDGHDGETYRGCVFRLPGKDRKTRLLAGYRDVAGDCYVVDFSDIYTSIPEESHGNYDNVLGEAARAGDRMAEKDAEQCREHDYKHMKATEWAELCDQISDVRCDCPAAATERDRLQSQIDDIESEFSDIAEFAEENL